MPVEYNLLDGLPEIEEPRPSATVTEREGLPVRYEETNLYFTRKPTNEEAEAVMHAVAQMQRKSSLWVGDAANALENMFGEIFWQFIPANLVRKTVQNCMNVCRVCPVSVRMETLDFGHYDAATGIKDANDRKEFIKRCYEEGLTVKEARRIKAEMIGKRKTKPKPDRETMLHCMRRIQNYLKGREEIFPPEFIDAVRTLAWEVEKV